MDRFQELSVFVAVAEEEGFAAAARRLQMSPPPVTRAITSLEKRLGVTLLNRTTRYVHHPITKTPRHTEETRAIAGSPDYFSCPVILRQGNGDSNRKVKLLHLREIRSLDSLLMDLDKDS